MKAVLICLFSGIFVTMIAVTIHASLDRSIFEAGNLLPDPWFQATLCDAYCGFLTFYCWVAYKESQWVPRTIWFLAIMLLGNFAMAAYVLIQLIRLSPNEPVSMVLQRQPSSKFEVSVTK